MSLRSFFAILAAGFMLALFPQAARADFDHGFCIYACFQGRCYIRPECLGRPSNGGHSIVVSPSELEREMELRHDFTWGTGSGPGSGATGPAGGSPGGGPGAGFDPTIHGPWDQTPDPFLNNAWTNVQQGDPIPPQLQGELDRMRAQLATLPSQPQLGEQWKLSYKRFLDDLRRMTQPGAPGVDPSQLPVPLPPTVSREQIHEDLSPLWKSVSDHELAQGAAEIAALDAKIAGLRATGIPELLDRAGVLEKELGRNFTDLNGLMKGLPFAAAPDTALFTSRYGPEGMRVRAGLNKILAVESSVGAFCASSSCAELGAFNAYAAELQTAHVLVDRLAFEGRKAEAGVLQDHLDVSVRALEGFARGLYSGAVEFAHGFQEAVINPFDTAGKLVGALMHYQKTWDAIQSRVNESWRVLVSGTPEQQGEVIGKLTFDVVSQLAGGEVGKVVEQARTLTYGASYTAYAEQAGLLTEVVSRAATIAAVSAASDAAVAAGRFSADFSTALKNAAEEWPIAFRAMVQRDRGVEALPNELPALSPAAVDGVRKLDALVPGAGEASLRENANATFELGTAASSRLSMQLPERSADYAQAGAAIRAAREARAPQAVPDYNNLKARVETLDVATGGKSAVFYSGGDEARAAAEAYVTADPARRILLEKTPGGAWLDSLDLFNKLDPGQAKQLWTRLSERYADGASGTVTVIINKAGFANPVSVFQLKELEVLLRNPNVAGIYGKVLQ